MYDTVTVAREGRIIAEGDAALAQAALDDPAAFTPLYRRDRDRVYWYIRARTMNDDDATDLTQQVFLRALDALPQYRSTKGPFAGWLFRIARNAIIDQHRRTRATVPWDLVPAAFHMATMHDPLASALRRESLDRLRALVTALDADKREMLVLRFVAGLTARRARPSSGRARPRPRKRSRAPCRP